MAFNYLSLKILDLDLSVFVYRIALFVSALGQADRAGIDADYSVLFAFSKQVSMSVEKYRFFSNGRERVGGIFVSV